MRYGQVCSGIFSSSRDKSIKLWSRGNPHVVREYLGHDLVVSAIDISKGIIICVKEYLGHDLAVSAIDISKGIIEVKSI